MCLNKSSFMRENRGKRATSFFFEFFQSIKFFLICLQKNEEEFYSLRARYRREYTSHNNNNSLILIARSKEKIYTHTHSDI